MARKKRSVPRPKLPKQKTPDPVVGKCPVCGREVLIHRYHYDCRGTIPKSNKFEDVMRPDCRFTMYRYPLKTLGKPEITPDEMRILLERKPIWLENLRRKDGRLFSCYGLLEHRDTGGWGIRFVRSAERGITFVRSATPGASTFGSPLRRRLGKSIQL